MLKIYITRHGETEWNVEGRMQGWKNSPLTQKGITNAGALGKRLVDVDIDVIYSSSSQRALHTAELIRGNREIPVLADENLREINLGEWEGKSADEMENIDREEQFAFWNTPHLYVPKSGESFFQVQERVEAVLNKILSVHSNGNVLIVAHAIVVKVMMAAIKELPLEKLWEQPFVHGTSLSLVAFENDKGTVLMEGDMSHAAI